MTFIVSSVAMVTDEASTAEVSLFGPHEKHITTIVTVYMCSLLSAVIRLEFIYHIAVKLHRFGSKSFDPKHE